MYTTYSELDNYESVSRGCEDTLEPLNRFHNETEYTGNRWGHKLEHDPATNVSLRLDHHESTLAFPPQKSIFNIILQNKILC
jgi:hypothetical protein